MKITPIDISGHRFAKRMRGYDPEEVRSFLNLVSGEFERLVIENNALKEELAQIKAGIADYKERERILKDTLVTAQKLAEDMKEEARKEAQLVVKEAEIRGGQLLDQAARKAGQIEGMIQNLRVERSEEHTSELQSRLHLVCRLLLEKKKKKTQTYPAPCTDYPPIGEL